MHEKFLHKGSGEFCLAPSFALSRALSCSFVAISRKNCHEGTQKVTKENRIPTSLFRGVHDRNLRPARKAGLSGRFVDGFPDAFDQRRSLEPVNLNGGPNRLATQLVSVLEKRMHEKFLHEGSEESCPTPLTRMP